MLRFLFWTFCFVIVGGVVLHFGIELPPFADWFGKLPGDMILMRGKVLIYLPVVSAVAVAFVFSFFLSLLFKKK